MQESKHVIVVQCKIEIPFHVEKSYGLTRTKKDIVAYIRGTLRGGLSFIPYENDTACSSETKISVKLI